MPFDVITTIIVTSYLVKVTVAGAPGPDSPITIRFNYDLQPWSVERAFALEPHVDGEVAYDRAELGRIEVAVDDARESVGILVDGGEFGFGAEIGISTQKLHARGPMGLTEMTTTKYVVTGDGHVR